MVNKRGQITIFIIVAIVLVLLIVGFFVVRNRLESRTTISDFEFVYERIGGCVENIVLEELAYAGIQGGYINLPKFEPGSEFAPFSSQLDFLGIAVPYWYYVSGNNLIKEQVPSINNIENDLAERVELRIKECDLKDFASQGYYVETGNPKASVIIRDKNVVVDLDYEVIVEKDGVREAKFKHSVLVNSQFGKFYALARNIYDKQLSESFLENYALDVVYNYAPVTGVEIGCSPMIWEGSEVVNDLRNGLSANIGMLRLKQEGINDSYFSVDFFSDVGVNFIYDSNWPTKIEIWPAENNLLVAEPVGIQEGLGILGFCYVPYHFVYDVYHPVLIQIFEGDELFQFTVAVVLEKTSVRNPFEGLKEEKQSENICNYRDTEVVVRVADYNTGELIEADVIYTCLNSRCPIGKTEIYENDLLLYDYFPQCFNGRLTVRSEGYVTYEEIVSIIEPREIFVELKKLHEFDVDLFLGNSLFSGDVSLISFSSEDYSAQVVYPDQKKVSLTEGLYYVGVQVFDSASLTMPASSSRQCVQIPSEGLLGFFGRTKEQCFDIDFPSQEIDMALIGGGNSNFFISSSDVVKTKIEVAVPRFSSPRSLEDIQRNYDLLDSSFAEVRLR